MQQLFVKKRQNVWLGRIFTTIWCYASYMDIVVAYDDKTRKK